MPTQKPRIIMNSDANELYFAPGNMKRSHLEAFYEEELQGTQVDVLAWCGALPDLTFYDSKVGEYWGKGKEEFPYNHFWNIHRNIKGLIEAGDDPLEVVTTLAHRLGIKLVASMRMNDIHHASDDCHFMRTSFLLNHLDWRLDRAPGNRSWGLDYAIEGVREHRFAILSEMAEEYDTDGLELDFNRSEWVFQPDHAMENVPIMTGFVRRARDSLDSLERKRCRRLILGVRCPTTVERCVEHGLDLPEWISEGLVDYVCPSRGMCIDFNTPVSEWVELAKATGCGIYPTLWREKGQGYRKYLNLEQFRAAAHSFYLQGADGVSTYNLSRVYMDQIPFHEPPLLREVGDSKLVAKGRRHYLYLHDFPTFNAEELGQRKAYPFRFCENLPQIRHATLRFKVENETKEDEFSFDLNGHPIASDMLLQTHPPMGRYAALGDCQLAPYLQYELPLSKGMVQVGDNELGARQLRKNPDLPNIACEMRELEIIVEP